MTSYLHLHQREGLIPLIVLKTRFLGLGALGFPYTLFLWSWSSVCLPCYKLDFFCVELAYNTA